MLQIRRRNDGRHTAAVGLFLRGLSRAAGLPRSSDGHANADKPLHGDAHCKSKPNLPHCLQESERNSLYGAVIKSDLDTSVGDYGHQQSRSEQEIIRHTLVGRRDKEEYTIGRWADKNINK